MGRFNELADEISSIEQRIADAIFDEVRAQLRGDSPAKAKEAERELSKVRRSLQKAEYVLRRQDED